MKSSLSKPIPSPWTHPSVTTQLPFSQAISSPPLIFLPTICSPGMDIISPFSLRQKTQTELFFPQLIPDRYIFKEDNAKGTNPYLCNFKLLEKHILVNLCCVTTSQSQWFATNVCFVPCWVFRSVLLLGLDLFYQPLILLGPAATGDLFFSGWKAGVHKIKWHDAREVQTSACAKQLAASHWPRQVSGQAQRTWSRKSSLLTAGDTGRLHEKRCGS